MRITGCFFRRWCAIWRFTYLLTYYRAMTIVLYRAQFNRVIIEVICSLEHKFSISIMRTFNSSCNVVRWYLSFRCFGTSSIRKRLKSDAYICPQEHTVILHFNNICYITDIITCIVNTIDLYSQWLKCKSGAQELHVVWGPDSRLGLLLHDRAATDQGYGKHLVNLGPRNGR